MRFAPARIGRHISWLKPDQSALAMIEIGYRHYVANPGQAVSEIVNCVADARCVMKDDDLGPSSVDRLGRLSTTAICPSAVVVSIISSEISML